MRGDANRTFTIFLGSSVGLDIIGVLAELLGPTTASTTVSASEPSRTPSWPSTYSSLASALSYATPPTSSPHAPAPSPSDVGTSIRAAPVAGSSFTPLCPSSHPVASTCESLYLCICRVESLTSFDMIAGHCGGPQAHDSGVIDLTSTSSYLYFIWYPH